MYKDENTDFQNLIYIAKSQIYNALEHCFSVFLTVLLVKWAELCLH